MVVEVFLVWWFYWTVYIWLLLLLLPSSIFDVGPYADILLLWLHGSGVLCSLLDAGKRWVQGFIDVCSTHLQVSLLIFLVDGECSCRTDPANPLVISS